MNVAGWKRYQDREMILITALGAPQPELVKWPSHRFQERAVRVSLSSTTNRLQAPVIRISTLVNTMKRFIIECTCWKWIWLKKENSIIHWVALKITLERNVYSSEFRVTHLWPYHCQSFIGWRQICKKGNIFKILLFYSHTRWEKLNWVRGSGPRMGPIWP